LGIALTDVNNWRYKVVVGGVPGCDAGAGAGAIEKGAAASMGMGGGCVMMGKPHECECQTPPF